MSDSIAIVQEQLAWWIAQGYTPREAMLAMDLDAPAFPRQPLTWGAVMDAALDRWAELARLRRDAHAARLGVPA